MLESGEEYEVVPIARIGDERIALVKPTGERLFGITLESEWEGASCRHVYTPNEAFQVAQALLEAVARAKREKRQCQVCGESLLDQRADAKTCSNKCRQVLSRRERTIRECL